MDCIIKQVDGHVEVYSSTGAFLFSADNTREAMEELAGLGGLFAAVLIRMDKRSLTPSPECRSALQYKTKCGGFFFL